jgi:hypothetical protein
MGIRRWRGNALHVRYHRLDSIAAWRDGVYSLDRRRDRFDSRHRPQAKIEFHHPLAPLGESLAVSRDALRRFGQSFFWFAKWVLAPPILGTLVIAGGVVVYQQGIDFDTFLNYFALGLLIFVVITLFYGIIAIHDVPYEIAKKRDHPHQDAIHAAGWVSLFTLHALWPFLCHLGDAPSPRARLGLQAPVRNRRFHLFKQDR